MAQPAAKFPEYIFGHGGYGYFKETVVNTTNNFNVINYPEYE